MNQNIPYKSIDIFRFSKSRSLTSIRNKKYLLLAATNLQLYNVLSFYSTTYNFILLGDFNIHRDNERLKEFATIFIYVILSKHQLVTCVRTCACVYTLSP